MTRDGKELSFFPSLLSPLSLKVTAIIVLRFIIYGKFLFAAGASNQLLCSFFPMRMSTGWIIIVFDMFISWLNGSCKLFCRVPASVCVVVLSGRCVFVWTFMDCLGRPSLPPHKLASEIVEPITENRNAECILSHDNWFMNNIISCSAKPHQILSMKCAFGQILRLSTIPAFPCKAGNV